MKIRNLLYLVPLLIFVTSPFWKPSVAEFLKPRGSSATGPEEDFSENKKNFKMETVHITLSTGGRTEWEVHAEQALTGKTDREFTMQTVNAVYTAIDGTTTQITSREGEYFIDKRHLILKDDVVILKPHYQQELRTDLLHYYDVEKIAKSPGEVRLRSQGLSLEAGRMDYDLSNDAYDFSNRVRVDI